MTNQNQPSSEGDSIFEKVVSPYVQIGIVLVTALLFMIIGAVAIGGERFPWTTAGSFMLLYAIFNSVFSINSEDLNEYWKHSILAYAGLVAGLSGLAYVFSGKWITEVGTFSWIFFILTFGYLAFLSIIGMVKGIYQIAMREDEEMHGKGK